MPFSLLYCISLHELGMIGDSFQLLVDIWIVSGLGLLQTDLSQIYIFLAVFMCRIFSKRGICWGRFVKTEVSIFGISVY